MEIGFMQGRLCDRVDGKIQAFPWRDWESEFPAAQAIGIGLMEWTLDQDRLRENPMLTSNGRHRIRDLSEAHGVRVVSVTGDCFMQMPFHKVEGGARTRLLDDLRAVVDAAADLGVSYVVFPLVDNGAIHSSAEETSLLDGMLPMRAGLVARNVKIIFESDFPAARLARFIEQFPHDAFGINYDIGNSAALGYQPEEEIGCYGARIDNVHVKDRVLHGTTVPLGTGNADFPSAFAALRKACYAGKFILQTARAEDNTHAATLARYRTMTIEWWGQSGS